MAKKKDLIDHSKKEIKGDNQPLSEESLQPISYLDLMDEAEGGIPLEEPTLYKDTFLGGNNSDFSLHSSKECDLTQMKKRN